MQHFLRLILILTLLIPITGCEKVYDDKIPPKLSLIGSNPKVLFLGCPFNDPGFTVWDDITPPELITVTTDIDSINLGSPGVYYIHYTATDTDGNSAFAKRKLIIEELSLNFYSGRLLAKDTLKPLNFSIKEYDVNCELFNETFSWIKVHNFNDFGDNFNVIMIPDSAGNIEVFYSLSDTVISGFGSTYCDLSGFRLEYLVETPDEQSLHYVSYIFD
jgi:hypothetical protein